MPSLKKFREMTGLPNDIRRWKDAAEMVRAGQNALTERALHSARSLQPKRQDMTGDQSQKEPWLERAESDLREFYPDDYSRFVDARLLERFTPKDVLLAHEGRNLDLVKSGKMGGDGLLINFYLRCLDPVHDWDGNQIGTHADFVMLAPEKGWVSAWSALEKSGLDLPIDIFLNRVGEIRYNVHDQKFCRESDVAALVARGGKHKDFA